MLSYTLLNLYFYCCDYESEVDIVVIVQMSVVRILTPLGQLVPTAVARWSFLVVQMTQWRLDTAVFVTLNVAFSMIPNSKAGVTMRGTSPWMTYNQRPPASPVVGVTAFLLPTINRRECWVGAPFRLPPPGWISGESFIKPCLTECAWTRLKVFKERSWIRL